MIDVADIKVIAAGIRPNNGEDDGPVVSMKYELASEPGHRYTNYYLCGRNDKARDALMAALQSLIKMEERAG